jgi:uncharacterized protein (TIGR03437 family)
VSATFAQNADETLEGVIRMMVEDRFDQGIAINHYQLETAAETLELVFPDGAPIADALPGSRVRVAGRRAGGRFIIGSRIADEKTGSGPSANLAMLQPEQAQPARVVGTRRIAVLLANFNDDTREVINSTEAARAIQLTSAYYAENSYQQFAVSGDVYGYLTLNRPSSDGCLNSSGSGNSAQALSLINEAMQTATAAGISLSPYQTVMVIVPTLSTCFRGGLGTVPPFAGQSGLERILLTLSSQYGADDVLPLYAHELGHNLGLLHAKALNCSPEIYVAGPSCTSIEYGDFFDTMGSGAWPKPAHFNAQYKEFLGWSAPAAVASTGIYSLSPAELPQPAGVALRLTPGGGGTPSFYVEYRRPIGFDDSFRFPFGYFGALVHLGIGNSTTLLNMHPESANSQGPPDPALRLGETYVDYINRFSLTTLSVGSTGLEMRILVAPPNTPTLMFTNPAPGAVVSGVVPVGVEALDRAGISRVELYSGAGLVGTDNTAPYRFSWDTSGGTGGAHTLTARAYNTTGGTFSSDLSLNVFSIQPPEVSMIEPSDGLLIVRATPVTLKARATAQSGGVTRVDFFNNGALIGQGVRGADDVFSFVWSLAPAGVNTITARARDGNGAVAVSQAIHITAQPTPTLDGAPATASGLAVVSAVAPGSLVSFYGEELAVEQAANSASVLPTTLGDVSVTFNGIPAPLLFVSNTQINAQVPWGVLPQGPASGSATAVVTSFGAMSAGIQVNVAPVAPGIFTLQYGVGQAIAINQDGTLAAPAGSVAGLITHATTAGDTILILATGLGSVTPAVADGESAGSVVRRTVKPVSVMVGGVPARVDFSGLSPQFPGVNQLNVVIPEGAPRGDAVPLQIQMDAITTSDQVTIAVQ